MSSALPRFGYWPAPAPLWSMPWQMMAQMDPPGYRPKAPEVSSLNHQDNACKDSLLSVIEQQIIPRLLKANALVHDEAKAGAEGMLKPHAEDIQHFALSCLSPDADISHGRMQVFRQQGFSTDQLFLDVIAPAARFLGVQWEQDQLDFSQVTLGLLRLHQLSHELGYAYRDGPQEAGARRRIMLASAPGSQHLLGLTIVSEFFRKERWQVVVEISSTVSDLAQALSNEWFDVVGLSVGLVEQIETIPPLIHTLRGHSRNPQVRVLLGGPAFISQPHDARQLGADGVSLDAAEAVVLAAQLLNADASPH
jgi:methanogenic corrinoid protein MtbC1